MTYSPAALGLTAGALLLRPLVFAFTVDDGWRRSCPHSHHPVLGAGWAAYADLALRRRCRTCATTVPAAVAAGPAGPAVVPQPPVSIGPAAGLPEVVTTVAVGAVVAAGADGWLAVLGAAMVLIDLRVQRLPDLLTGLAATGVALYLAAEVAAGPGWSELLWPAAGVVLVCRPLPLAERLGLLGLGET